MSTVLRHRGLGSERFRHKATDYTGRWVPMLLVALRTKNTHIENKTFKKNLRSGMRLQPMKASP